MKELYILRDTLGQLQDVVLTDVLKAERIVKSSNGRLTFEKILWLNDGLDCIFYERELAQSQLGRPQDRTRQAREIAQILLEKEAVTINADEPYIYVSGLRSPIYCDNRRLIFFPNERRIISHAFAERVRSFSPDVIAGTASSAIPWATWVAALLNRPMVYIRKASKEYGQRRLIEGGDIRGISVVVLEDLVSTGGSSLNAVNACREAGANVLSMMAIFTYEFQEAAQKFRDARCHTEALTNFSTLVQVAAEKQMIRSEKITMIQEWNTNPQQWGPRHGFPNVSPMS
ncbi:orotate phosphoribosyltransferase [Candidatus Vecturithrix granuli]|uniref:Orotate phosphoribosyltransferase n=1 Tax=Vecturithrix granuli TaxID=1499967 RepID=A0A081C134_VECG1|nr:orotate phosphoribosyltransferase [Candidatus Vecturithrix granuli]